MFTVLPLLFSVLVLLPALVLLGNSNEFSYGLLYALRIGALLCLAGTLVFGLLQSIFLRRFSDYVSVVLIWLLVGSYVQSQFLVWDYGSLDGTPIAWNEYVGRGWIDLGVWAVLAVLAAWKTRWVKLHASRLSILIVGLHAISLLPQVGSAPQLVRRPPAQELQELFSLSKESNVIHIVLDALQSPAFERAITVEPELKDSFSGFTYFRNTTSAFPSTLPSVPAFLTGVPFDASVPLRRYYEETFKKSSLPTQLAAQGFSSRLATIPGFCQFFAPGMCGEARRFPGKSDLEFSISEYAEQLDLALFRASPQFLKKHIYRNEQWLVQSLLAPKSSVGIGEDRGVLFAREFIQKVHVSSDKPTYRFLHFLFPHPPIRLNAECEPLASFERIHVDNFTRQTRCALRVAADIVNRLKALGVYDNSIIILSADHGTRLDFGQNQKNVLKDRNLPPISRALPLLMIKPKGAKGALQTSEAPAQLMDLPATVSSLLGVSMQFPGRTVFELGPQEERKRSFYDFSFRWSKWREVGMDDTFNGFPVFTINGHAWDAKSWTRVGQAPLVDK